MDEVMSDPCPRMLRLKQPSRSHPRESAPHCGKTTLVIISGTAATHHRSSPSDSFTDLQDDACGLVEVHHLFDHWLEELAVT